MRGDLPRPSLNENDRHEREEGERKRPGEQLGYAEEPELGHRSLEHRDRPGEDGELAAEGHEREEYGTRPDRARKAPGDEQVRQERHEEKELDRAGPLDEG